ncbi:hypothetical protein, partial [Marilutibacter maris]|uniref:hypothetical protein n=1 Tax=Marilutibacter maris TaxID=1605891 RepID=UPI001B869269
GSRSSYSSFRGRQHLSKPFFLPPLRRSALASRQRAAHLTATFQTVNHPLKTASNTPRQSILHLGGARIVHIQSDFGKGVDDNRRHNGIS